MDIFATKSMPNKSPIFPIPQHFTDYGFEPQIDYFQVLEEARKHKRESIDVHFKLQKPISRDESSKKIKKSKKRWWRNALLFFRFPKRAPPSAAAADHEGRRRIGSMSGPIYVTDSRSGASTPYRPGPLVKGGDGIPYFSLRELNAAAGRRISAAETPIYLVR
ncbi:hypothetical protein SASPL_103721 [Salvia splendens]|uniref:Uncharacterized protein n=1 Tax=Salvia splendens TaxID=180675 RepID=A0A8X9A7U8_SALSN|nr:uncharacterized protein LOC121771555 [Salvia splendens]KAG6432147.1 hypothetical protein SASPL_103721 [Salvia splendens]